MIQIAMIGRRFNSARIVTSITVRNVLALRYVKDVVMKDVVNSIAVNAPKIVRVATCTTVSNAAMELRGVADAHKSSAE